MMRKTGFLLLAWLCLATTPAQAWTAFGHRLVGELAQSRLSPAAQAQVDALLATEQGADTLAGIAAWADSVRDLPAYRATAPLHYVNFRDARCQYRPQRDCPRGDCVVAALARHAKLLADEGNPVPVRLEALKFVVHLVGDIHQPLHAGHRDDRGGNRFQVNLAGKGSNLHAVWDFDLLTSAGLGFAAYRQRLAPRLAQTPAGALDPRAWAEESCKLLDAEAIYPPRPGKLPADYLDRHRPLAEQRIVLAAARLADLLEQALAER
ncbi:MAG: S1/P1 nuclease [Lysobacteraceae bacterium]|jgi:hypothetical protein